MPRIELYTNATPEVSIDAVARSCESTGFVVDSKRKRQLMVRKGSLALSVLFGVFVAYANAQVTVDMEEDDTVIDFEWGATWWQGVFGPVRTRKAMVTLIDEVEHILEEAGWEVVDRVER